MRVSRIDELEARLESLIEGVFARMRGSPVRAREVAIMLLRALEDEAKLPAPGAAQATAPDRYEIRLHPANLAESDDIPELTRRLVWFVVELCAETGYRLEAPPHVTLREDRSLDVYRVIVRASHTARATADTRTMAAPQVPRETFDAQPWLTINGEGFIQLTQAVVNIGRAADNDIVIADKFVSRRHLQLRQRAGGYILLDLKSRGGTRVNGIATLEHRLQNGDVIEIGRSLLVYAGGTRQARRDGETRALRAE